MYPVLFRLGALEVATHDAFVVLGVAAALVVFRFETRRRAVDRRAMSTIAAGSLLTGAVFAKASTAWRYVTESSEPSLLGVFVHGGKSILGGLAGAYLGVLATKRLIGFREKTGDVFAPAVAMGLAVGRIGCFLTEQIGTPTSLPWGITPSAEVAARIPNCPQCLLGVALHPSFLYEIAFHLAMFGVLLWLRPRIRVPGELFMVYLLGYGLFRFAVEFVRGNATMALGLSGSQLFLAGTLPLLISYFIRQLARHAYRRAPAVALAGREVT